MPLNNYELRHPRCSNNVCASVKNIVDVLYTSFASFGQNPGQIVTTEIWSATVIFVKIRALKPIILCVKECQFLLITFIARFVQNSTSLQRSIQNVTENSSGLQK